MASFKMQIEKSRWELDEARKNLFQDRMNVQLIKFENLYWKGVQA